MSIRNILKTLFFHREKKELNKNNLDSVSQLLETRILELKTELELQKQEHNHFKEQADIELHSIKDKYNAIFENLQDIFYQVDLAGNILELSPSINLHLEFNRDELIGSSVFNLYYNSNDRIILMDSILENGELRDFRLTLKTKTGAIKYVSLNARLIFDSEGKPNHIDGIIRDISERKLADEELRASEQKYLLLLENFGIGVGVYSLNGDVLYFNQKAVENLGGKPEDYIGRSLLELFGKEAGSVYIKRIQEASNSESSIEFEDFVSLPTGDYWFLSNHTKVVDTEGKTIGVQVLAHDITQRKQAEQVIRESEEHFRAIFDQAPIAIALLDLQGRPIISNTSLSKMVGYSNDELSKMKFTEFTYSEDINIDLNHFTDLIDGKISRYNMEKRYVHKNGRIVWANLFVTMLRDKNGIPKDIIGMVEDITIRKNAEAEITMLAQSLKSISECLSITDLNDKILFVNESFLKTYGYELDELIGKQISMVWSPNNAQEVVENILPDTISGEWKGELLNKRKDGSEFSIFLSTSIIMDKNNQPIGLIGVATDITERKRAEEELIEAKNKAEESDRLKSAFLANMSHEIRTPMNGVLGFVGLLKEPDLTGEEKDEYISLIETSGIRMLNIINDIIDISKVESGQMKLSIKETNINEQLDFIYTFFKPEAEQKGIQLLYNNSLPVKEAYIKSDKEKIYAILTNLVKNALKFTSSGTIEFGYNLRSDRTPAELEFFVRDTGIGIKPEKLDLIFERFRQGSESLNRNYEGAGLGLTISKAYVEMLGGKIWMESEMGKGSIFYFTLPYNLVVEERAATKNHVFGENATNQMISDFSGLKVLIAEDDKISEKYAILGVKAFSKEILKAKTGTKAVEICYNNPDIDLILMDIKMPEMDGLEATRQIRKFNTTVVIIAQTAFALTGDLEMALLAGCNDYLTKPFGKSSLNSLIEKHFKNRIIN